MTMLGRAYCYTIGEVESSVGEIGMTGKDRTTKMESVTFSYAINLTGKHGIRLSCTSFVSDLIIIHY